MTGASETETAAAPIDADRDLVVLFTRALHLLGDAGYPVAANRLAAKAWWTLQVDDSAGANRISGVMHYLAKLPDEVVPIDRRRTTDPKPACKE